jgi:hypothetical protein
VNAAKTEVSNVSEKIRIDNRPELDTPPHEKHPPKKLTPEQLEWLGDKAVKGKQRSDLQNAQRVAPAAGRLAIDGKQRADLQNVQRGLGQTALRGERKSEPKRDEPTR